MFKRLVNFIALFGSFSTLLCCAIPAALVTIGMGATFASLTSAFPQIIWLGQHKGMLFTLTGVLLVISYCLMKYSEQQSCPIDPKLQEACKSSKTWSRPIFWISVGLYSIGLLFAYLLPRFLYGA